MHRVARVCERPTSSSSSNAPLFDSSSHPRRVSLIPIFFLGGGRKGKKRRSLRDFLSNSIVSWKMDVFFLKRRMRVLFSRGGKFRWKIHAVIFPLAGQSQRNVCRGQITMYFVYFTIIHPPSSKSLEDGFVDSFDTLFDWTAFLDRTNPSNVRLTDAPRCNLRV